MHSELISANTQLRAERERQLPDDNQIKNLEAGLRKARSTYEGFQTSLYAAHPELRIKRAVLPAFTTSDAAAAIPDERTAVLEYVVTDSHTLLFVIWKRPDEKIDIRVCRINIVKGALTRQAEAFRHLLATNAPGYRQPGRDLFELLIKPAASYIGDKTSLCIIPDGPLWQLPFQALESPEEKYLLESHAIYYAPSVMVLREMKKRTARLGSAPIGKNLSRSDEGLFAVANPLTSSEVVRHSGIATAQHIILPDTRRHSVTNIKVNPPSGRVLLNNQKVSLDFSYATRDARGVRIFAIPFVGNQPAPNVVSNDSPLYPSGRGMGGTSFTISSGNVSIDHLALRPLRSTDSRNSSESLAKSILQHRSPLSQIVLARVGLMAGIRIIKAGPSWRE